MSQAIIDMLNKGIEANHADRFRQGNIVRLPREGSLVITGDIHGHRRNFERITSFCDLENNPTRHVILQEIIHGGSEDSEGGCLSYQLLFDIVRYKLSFPDQVHILIGNHDTSFINNSKVMKNGKEMNASMRQALEREFKESCPEVKLALSQFLFSQPLALRTENRIWASHSLPSARLLDKFDPEILDRELKVNDCVKPGSAYLLTWGRGHTQSVLDKMAEMFDIDIFILGHQAQPQGWGRLGNNLIIVASDHNHGCLIPIELDKSYSLEQLVDSIVPLASIS